MQRVEISSVDPPAPSHVRAPCPYLAHYGLRAVPFRMTTDPRRLWLGRVRRPTFDTLTAALRDDETVVVLTGGVGTGKTSLAHGVAERLRDAGLLVGLVPHPGAKPSEFVQAVAAALGVDPGSVSSFQQLFDRAKPAGKKLVLIIDEAQDMEGELLRQTAELPQIASRSGPALAVLLVGNDHLNALLADPHQEMLNRQVTVRCTLQSLSAAEVAEYIRHYLATAGAHYEIFSADAIHEIAMLSHGTPAAINVLGELALLTGRQRGVRTITQAIVADSGFTPAPVERAVPTKGRSVRTPRPHRPAAALLASRGAKISLGLFAAAVLVAGGYSVYAAWHKTTRREPPTARAPLAVEPLQKAPTADTPAPATPATPSSSPPSAAVSAPVGTSAPPTERAAPVNEAVVSVPSIPPSIPAQTAAPKAAVPAGKPPSVSSLSQRPAAAVAPIGVATPIEHPAPPGEGIVSVPPTPSPIRGRSAKPAVTVPREREAAGNIGTVPSLPVVPRREIAVGSKPATPPAMGQRSPRPDAAVSPPPGTDPRDQERETPDPGGIVDWFLKEYSPSNR